MRVVVEDVPDVDQERAPVMRVVVDGVVVDPSEDVPKRHELQVEWITNRMNFLLASQAFLIAAYIALLVENRDSEIVKQVEIKDYWIKMIPKISLLHVVAMSISILAAQIVACKHLPEGETCCEQTARYFAVGMRFTILGSLIVLWSATLMKLEDD